MSNLTLLDDFCKAAVFILIIITLLLLFDWSFPIIDFLCFLPIFFLGDHNTGAPQAQHWQQNYPPPTDNKVTLLANPAPAPAISAKPYQPPLLGPVSHEPPSTSSSLGLGSEKPFVSPSPGTLGLPQGTFSYEELAMATNGFSNTNLVGQGGFGYVHKGVLLDGKVVAIKQLKPGSGQGEREFQAEIEIISRIHHRHLVSLIGYCITGAQRMLVYEFIPNNTLEFHLHGECFLLSHLLHVTWRVQRHE